LGVIALGAGDRLREKLDPRPSAWRAVGTVVQPALRSSETKLPAAGRCVSSVGRQRVSVTAMPSKVLVGAGRHHCRAVPIGACEHALIGARIELG
jgi:hypothetical protein